MTRDPSNGWNGVAAKFIKDRSDIGRDVIAHWISTLPRGASVFDIGCGFGDPVTRLLRENGMAVYAIEPSKNLVAEFQRRLPGIPIRCETIEESSFYNRTFDAICTIGLLFLLPIESQIQLFKKVSSALDLGGQFLFSAPAEICEWDDLLTSRRSVSLGLNAYKELCAANGLELLKTKLDAGGNHYYFMQKVSA